MATPARDVDAVLSITLVVGAKAISGFTSGFIVPNRSPATRVRRTFAPYDNVMDFAMGEAYFKASGMSPFKVEYFSSILLWHSVAIIFFLKQLTYHAIELRTPNVARDKILGCLDQHSKMN